MARLEGHWRDIVIAVAVVGGILLVLYLYTGNWPPPVVVESNSMMHVDGGEYSGNRGDTRAAGVPYGRFGTIDPGDLVLVKRMDSVDDIDTFARGRSEHYGLPGDVIVYYRGDPNLVRGSQTPIIHRAMTHVEVTGTGDARRYEVQWTDAWDEPGEATCRRMPVYTCTFGSEGMRIPGILDAGSPKRFQRSGFITKGDNTVGNTAADQQIGIISEPVPFEWVQGAARGELPWFGLIKLMITGTPKNLDVSDHPYYPTIGKMTAPRDVWIMLVVGVLVVGLAPVGIDMATHRIKEHRARKNAPPPSDGAEGPVDSVGPPEPTVEPETPADPAATPEEKKETTAGRSDVEIDLE